MRFCVRTKVIPDNRLEVSSIPVCRRVREAQQPVGEDHKIPSIFSVQCNIAMFPVFLENLGPLINGSASFLVFPVF